MSLSSEVFLGALRLQAQQRCDMENNPAISDEEWNQYLSQSYKRLYNLLIAAYGEDYYFSLPYQFVLNQGQFYNLPDGSGSYLLPNGSPAPAFYKLMGVDLQYSGSPTGWVTLPNFNFIDRNKFAYPNTTVNLNGYTNLKYRIAGNQLMLIPSPVSGQIAQIWYAPKPTAISFFPVCSSTAGSTTLGVFGALDLAVAMSVAGPGIVPGTAVTAVNTTLNQVTLSTAATLTNGANCIQFWTDSATFDGIAGWEEYVIVDAAIKGATKCELSVSNELLEQKKEMVQEIENMAKGRDIGEAQHTSDAIAIHGDGNGNGGGWFGGQGGGW